MDTLLSTNISRRTLAKGAAWATPVVVATAAVPAYAASNPKVPTQEQIVERQKSLQGYFEVLVTCPASRTAPPDFVLTGDTLPYPTGGFYVGGTNSASVIDGASFTLYIGNNQARHMSWFRDGNTNGWSLPVINSNVAPAMQGYTAYTFFYNGANWAFDSALNRHYINETPNFKTWFSNWICPNAGVAVRGYRRVNIDGQLYEFWGRPGNVIPS